MAEVDWKTHIENKIIACKNKHYIFFVTVH